MNYLLCRETGKRRFPSAKLARVASRQLGGKVCTYRCPHCGSIHITKPIRREYRDQ